MAKKKETKKSKLLMIIDKVLYEKAKVEDEEGITIAVNMSVTMNMGNYESLKYGLSASMKAKAEYSKEVKEALEKYVMEEIKKKYEEFKPKEDVVIGEPNKSNIDTKIEEFEEEDEEEVVEVEI